MFPLKNLARKGLSYPTNKLTSVSRSIYGSLPFALTAVDAEDDSNDGEYKYTEYARHPRVAVTGEQRVRQEHARLIVTFGARKPHRATATEQLAVNRGELVHRHLDTISVQR